MYDSLVSVTILRCLLARVTEFGIAGEKTHDAQGHPEPRA